MNKTKQGMGCLSGLGGGGGTQPIFGSPALGNLYVLGLGEVVDEDSGKGNADEEEKLEKDNEDEAIVNGTASSSLPN